jgi:hypothetical protein
MRTLHATAPTSPLSRIVRARQQHVEDVWATLRDAVVDPAHSNHPSPCALPLLQNSGEQYPDEDLLPDVSCLTSLLISSPLSCSTMMQLFLSVEAEPFQRGCRHSSTCVYSSQLIRPHISSTSQQRYQKVEGTSYIFSPEKEKKRKEKSSPQLPTFSSLRAVPVLFSVVSEQQCAVPIHEGAMVFLPV